jgi:hypothetical protein
MSKEQLHNLVLYKINPNQQELDGDVSFDKNVDGRIFNGCKFEVLNDTVMILDEKNQLQGIFSLHHFYLLHKNF